MGGMGSVACACVHVHTHARAHACMHVRVHARMHVRIAHTHTSLVAHWKPATTLSLISFRYCTPFVQSVRRLGPVPSGPKHQILRASVASHSYFSARKRARCLGSIRGVISPWRGGRGGGGGGGGGGGRAVTVSLYKGNSNEDKKRETKGAEMTGWGGGRGGREGTAHAALHPPCQCLPPSHLGRAWLS